MTKVEFIKKIENGSDIMFNVDKMPLVIFTWCENGIGIGEQHKDTPLSYFETANELVENYRVNGIPLADLCDKIVITDYS